MSRCTYAEMDWYCVLPAGHTGNHMSQVFTNLLAVERAEQTEEARQQAMRDKLARMKEGA